MADLTRSAVLVLAPGADLNPVETLRELISECRTSWCRVISRSSTACRRRRRRRFERPSFAGPTPTTASGHCEAAWHSKITRRGPIQIRYDVEGKRACGAPDPAAISRALAVLKRRYRAWSVLARSPTTTISSLWRAAQAVMSWHGPVGMALDRASSVGGLVAGDMLCSAHRGAPGFYWRAILLRTMGRQSGLVRTSVFLLPARRLVVGAPRWAAGRRTPSG